MPRRNDVLRMVALTLIVLGVLAFVAILLTWQGSEVSPGGFSSKWRALQDSIYPRLKYILAIPIGLLILIFVRGRTNLQ